MNSSVRLYYPSEKETEQPQCKITPPQLPVPVVSNPLSVDGAGPR